MKAGSRLEEKNKERERKGPKEWRIKGECLRKENPNCASVHRGNARKEEKKKNNYTVQITFFWAFFFYWQAKYEKRKKKR